LKKNTHSKNAYFTTSFTDSLRDVLDIQHGDEIIIDHIPDSAVIASPPIDSLELENSTVTSQGLKKGTKYYTRHTQ